MKLYIIAILIILFTSCSNKQFSFRDKVNVKREHVVKRDKPIKPHFLSKDSSINESITASVNETFLPTNNFVDGNNVVINFRDTPLKNNLRITPSPDIKQKDKNVTPPNLDKAEFPILGVTGLVLSIIGVFYLPMFNSFVDIWTALGITGLLLLLGLTFSSLGLEQPKKGYAIAGVIISTIAIITLLITLLLALLIFMVFTAMGRGR